MRWQSTPLGLVFHDRGSVDAPAIALEVWSQEPLGGDFLAGLAGEVSYRCSLGLDLGDFNRRFAAHSQLGPAIARWRGMRPLNVSSLYEYLMIAVVLQNATVRRSVQMMQALYEHFGVWLAFDGQALACSWTPAELAAAGEDELRARKVGYRARSIARVTQDFARGDIDELALRDSGREEQRRALLALYGVGPASVEYILADVFHRLDAMEHISPWEQKIYSRLFFGRDPADPAPVGELLAYFDGQFAPYQRLAVHYLWEDLFWQQHQEPAPWLDALIKL